MLLSCCTPQNGSFTNFPHNQRSPLLPIRPDGCSSDMTPSAPRQHEFPKSNVDVFVHVLQDDGGALAAAITAAGAALADASVPMYDLVTAAALVGALTYRSRSTL